MQSFLFSTCLLEHLCASLCDAVTGQTEGAAILERLGRDNIFLLSLDDERQWYRYHLLTNQIDVAEMQLRDAKKILAARDDAVPSLSPENAEDGKCLRAERDTDEAMREGFGVKWQR